MLFALRALRQLANASGEIREVADCEHVVEALDPRCGADVDATALACGQPPLRDTSGTCIRLAPDDQRQRLD
jgi:hypothetical protein